MSRYVWTRRELQRKCLKRKRVMREANKWAIETNSVLSNVLGSGYGVRFKSDRNAPQVQPPANVKDAQAWDYVSKRLHQLEVILDEVTQLRATQ